MHLFSVAALLTLVAIITMVSRTRLSHWVARRGEHSRTGESAMNRVSLLWIVALLALAPATTLTANDTQPCGLCVRSFLPGSIDLIAPPATFTIAGEGFVDDGFGLPVANFTRGGAVVGQARALTLVGSITLTVPFPTNATSISGPWPGLSAGEPVLVQVYNQTGPTSYLLVGSAPLIVQDSRPPARVASITPSSFDLTKSLPTAFTIAGQRFADTGFGLPVVNFTRAERLVGQARASSLIEDTTLNVPFPTDSTSLNGPLSGLSTAGAVLVEVYNQTGPSSYLIVGSTTLTVNDMRPCALCVRSVTPNSIDMFASPATFIIAGGGFADKGFGLPVVNFTRAGVLLAQARANSLVARSTLTVPFPTDSTSLKGPLPGLSPRGPVLVQVYNQTGPSSYLIVGSTPLSVQDSGPPAQVTNITPSSFDLANPLPVTFTVAGERFTDTGFGAPVVNLSRAGVLLGQARASSLGGRTTLIVPFPTDATSLRGPLPGVLGAGPVLVQVYNQTGSSSYSLVGGISLNVTDSRPLQVTGITPNSIDLATHPAIFTIDGQRFADNGFGRPIVNFMRDGVVLGQARATSLVGSTTLTVPFPTNTTSLSGPAPGLTAGTVLVEVYNQTGPGSYLLIGSITLTVTDSRPGSSSPPEPRQGDSSL
jgi:allophanate hydrolase subunit 1